MKIIETQVTEVLAEEVEKQVTQSDSLVCIDSSDVKRILEGKTGVMYQGQEDPSVGYASFFQSFFAELLAKEQVKNCQCILLSVGNLESAPLNMTDIGLVNTFIDELPSEVEAVWSVVNTQPEDGLTITAVCTRSV